MKLSFDLDDTLIPPTDACFPTEERSIIQRLIGVEKIRREAGDLFRYLQAQGHEVGIYTTSYRPKLKLRLHLVTYRIYPDFIITEKENRIALAKKNVFCSKCPPAFGIDLHIDDSGGVAREGTTHGFRTIIVHKDDLNWLEKVKSSCQ